MQLRYNVSQIEEFLSRRNMRDAAIIKELSPLVQSSQLMQVKKQDEKDATALLTMCDALTGAQVYFTDGLESSCCDFLKMSFFSSTNSIGTYRYENNLDSKL